MSCRPVIQKKGKTITRYSVVSKRECNRFFTPLPPPLPPPALCGDYSNYTVLDGGLPNTTAVCILDGGYPTQTSNIILIGGSP